MKIYVIGSLRNQNVANVAHSLRVRGHDVFDDFMAAGPEADDEWKSYEQGRGRSYIEALGGHAATHVYEFDRKHLEECDAAVLVCPAGKSGHLELGWVLGRGKKGYVLLDTEDIRWDIMYKFADGVFISLGDLVEGAGL